MIIGFFTDVLLFLSHPCCDSTPTYIMVEWESECCTNEGPSKNVFLTNWGIFQWMIDPFVFLVLCRALLSCVGLGPSFVLEMVTTRAMSRRLRKGGSAPSLSPGSIGSDQTPVRVELETALRVEATSFLPAPAPSFLSGDFGSIIPEDAPTAPPIDPSLDL